MLDIAGRFLGLAIQLCHIFAIQLDGNIRLGTGHQLIEAKLDRLTEVELGSVDRSQFGLHLLHHFRPATGRSPFAERLHDDHDISIFHRHRIGRHLSRTDLGHDVFDFREFRFQFLLGFQRYFNTPAQRTAGRQSHLHGKVSFIQGRNKFGTQPGKEKQRSSQQGKRRHDRSPDMLQAEAQATPIQLVQMVEEAVGQRWLHRNLPFQEQRGHHRHIGERQKQSPDNTEHQRLGHRGEIFSFNARQSQNREEHNQDNQHGKGRTAHHLSGTCFHFPVHFFPAQLTSGQSFPINMCQDSFQDNNRAIHHNTEVDRSQTHQVGRNIRDAHQDESEQHGQRNDRRHNQSGTHISQENNQDHKHDQRAFDQVADHGRDIPIHQFRAVQIRLDMNTFGQHLLYFLHPLFQFLGDNIGIGSFQHHGNSAHAFAFAVFRHGTKAFGSTETDFPDIADMNRNAAPVGYHDLLNIFQLSDHTFRTDVVGTIHLLDVTSPRVLVVPTQGFEYFADRDIERVKRIRIDRHLILLQITTEAIDLNNPRNTRQLALHNPILNRAQFHRVILLLISRIHLQYILINFTQTGGYRHQFRCSQFERNLTGNGLNLFVDQLASIQRGHILLENHRHQREAETRNRADFFHVHDIAHGNLDRESDQLLDLLRSKRWRNRHNLHLIVGNVGHSINGQCQHRINTSDQQENRSQCHKQFLADGETDNRCKHNISILNRMANVQIMYCLSSRNPVKLTNRRVNYLFWLVIFSGTT
ncbi:putative uncharacterized protein [Parabacteroides sp. CAG:409]|nr:putative uncharacterized protein [Parabacteroides sp. CAG:409]